MTLESMAEQELLVGEVSSQVVVDAAVMAGQQPQKQEVALDAVVTVSLVGTTAGWSVAQACSED